MSAAEKVLADIIDRHEYDVNLATGLPRPACTCGWVAEADWTNAKGHPHTAHVTRMLAPVLADVWDEGHRFTGYDPTPGENPYRAGGAS